MPKPFNTNPDENAGKMKGRDYKESLEGGDMPAAKASETMGPNSQFDKDPGTPKGEGRRSVGSGT